MKRLYFLSLFTFYLHTDPLLVISLMVKNEETVMRATLEPFLQAGLKDYVIYDTGSTDSTVNVTRELFQEYGLTDTQAYIIQEPFVDFSTSRNRALDLVDEKFPAAVFTLMLDAEWYMHNIFGLIEFCKQYRFACEATYCFKINVYDLESYAQRLIRNTSYARFNLPVHEVLDKLAGEKLPDSVYVTYNATKSSLGRSSLRWQRDVTLLLKYLETHPSHPRATFYIAQSYDGLGDMHNAYAYYKLRTTLGGFQEEVFLSHYRMGTIAHQFYATDENFTWAQAVNDYLNAYAYRPSRIEPLVQLAFHYYKNNNMPLCYLFARQAAETPMTQDYFCVEKHMYALSTELLNISASSQRLH